MARVDFRKTVNASQDINIPIKEASSEVLSPISAFVGNEERLQEKRSEKVVKQYLDESTIVKPGYSEDKEFLDNLIYYISLDLIYHNPVNEDTYTLNDIETLSDDIKCKGFLGAIAVRKISYEKFEIISGHRRYEAAKMAGLELIPCQVTIIDSDAVAYERLLRYNNHNRKMTIYDWVGSVNTYLKYVDPEKAKQGGRERERIAEFFDISTAQASNLLSLRPLMKKFAKFMKMNDTAINAMKRVAAMDNEQQDALIGWLFRNNQESITLSVLNKYIQENQEKDMITESCKKFKSLQKNIIDLNPEYIKHMPDDDRNIIINELERFIEKIR